MKSANLQNAHQTLQSLLQRSHLSAQELEQGILACFTLTMARFVQRRQPQADEAKIAVLTQDLIAPVYERLGLLSRRRPTHGEWRTICRTIEEQLSFAAEPDLLAEHETIIEKLLEKYTP